MKVSELIDKLEDCDPDKEVKIKPHHADVLSMIEREEFVELTT